MHYRLQYNLELLSNFYIELFGFYFLIIIILSIIMWAWLCSNCLLSLMRSIWPQCHLWYQQGCIVNTRSWKLTWCLPTHLDRNSLKPGAPGRDSQTHTVNWCKNVSNVNIISCTDHNLRHLLYSSIYVFSRYIGKTQNNVKISICCSPVNIGYI